MPFKVQCGGCGTKFSVPDSALGKKARCSKCSAQFRVERPPQAASAQTPQVAAAARSAARSASGTTTRVAPVAPPRMATPTRSQLPVRKSIPTPAPRVAIARSLTPQNPFAPEQGEVDLPAIPFRDEPAEQDGGMVEDAGGLPPDLSQLQSFADEESAADAIELAYQPPPDMIPLARVQTFATPVAGAQTFREMKQSLGGAWHALGPFAKQQGRIHHRGAVGGSCFCCGKPGGNVYQVRWRGRADKASFSLLTLLTMFAGFYVIKRKWLIAEYTTHHRFCEPCGRRLSGGIPGWCFRVLGYVLGLIGVTAWLGSVTLAVQPHAAPNMAVPFLVALAFSAGCYFAFAAAAARGRPKPLRDVAPRPFRKRQVVMVH